MNMTHPTRSFGIIIISLFAIAFGLMTIKSGGSVLFLGDEFRQQAGSYVPFVLWFNFLAGFAYLIFGLGFCLYKKWAPQLAALIATASIVVFVLFGCYIYANGNHEMRTVVAMTIRCLAWILIALFSRRYINSPENK